MNFSSELSNSDWLNVRPKILTNGQLLDPRQLSPVQDFDEIDLVGLAGYLEFGYSIFGKTPFSNVEFTTPWLRPNPQPDGIFVLGRATDQTRFRFKEFEPVGVTQLLQKIKSNVLRAVEDFNGPIVLPLSGGLDSRLILWALRGVTRGKVHAFTYGTSFPQKASREVFAAKALASKEGVRWHQIEIAGSNLFHERARIDHGPLSHLHGMYHWSFYSRVAEILGTSRALVISGSVGDAWAGSLNPIKISKPADIGKLALSHGLRGSKFSVDHFSKLKQQLFASVFESMEQEFRDPLFNVVQLIRLKMSLLRYLHTVPESLGFEVFAPFHDEETAFGMLKLPKELRENRRWQHEFLASEDLNQGVLAGTLSNSLNFQILQEGPIELNFDCPHAQVFNAKYLKQVRALNQTKPVMKILNISQFGGRYKNFALNKVGVLNPSLWAYVQSLILAPIFLRAADLKFSDTRSLSSK